MPRPFDLMNAVLQYPSNEHDNESCTLIERSSMMTKTDSAETLGRKMIKIVANVAGKQEAAVEYFRPLPQLRTALKASTTVPPQHARGRNHAL